MILHDLFSVDFKCVKRPEGASNVHLRTKSVLRYNVFLSVVMGSSIILASITKRGMRMSQSIPI